DGGVSCNLEQRRLTDGHDRRARRHRLDDREPESLVAARLHETGRAAIQLDETIRLDVSLEACSGSPELGGERAVLLGAGDDEREPRVLGGGERGKLVLAPLDRTDRE